MDLHKDIQYITKAKVSHTSVLGSMFFASGSDIMYSFLLLFILEFSTHRLFTFHVLY